MTADIESLVLEHLRAIRADIGDLRTRMTGVESRLGSLETVVAGMRRDLAHMYGDVVEGNGERKAWTQPALCRDFRTAISRKRKGRIPAKISGRKFWQG